MGVSEALRKNWRQIPLLLLAGLLKRDELRVLMLSQKSLNFFSVEIVFPGENQKRDEVRQLEEKIEVLLNDHTFC